MKISFASILASLPCLAFVSAREIPTFEKMSISDAQCEDIHLVDNHVLHATCKNPYLDPAHTSPQDLEMDLDDCFANYKGTLNNLMWGPGGFSGSCIACFVTDDIKLVCQCYTGEGRKTKYNEFDLDNWRVIKLTLEDFNLRCAGDTSGWW
ncbi:hypothetical protein F5Y09DRAFT_352663 [Xylaria sp. FL1042]|nr:hypothetical protein F5Y09DRAFT_352663 [Xylaria sp. FL1042]